MLYESVELRHLENGDQIAVMGNVADLSQALRLLLTCTGTGQYYYHHGIYDKNNTAVIHFTGDNKADAKPQKSDFTKFFAGHKQLYRVVYKDNEGCLPVDEVMQRAEDALKQAHRWPGYDIIRNNCESFATLLKTGKAISRQAIEALIPATVGAGLVIAATGKSIGSIIGNSGSCS